MPLDMQQALDQYGYVAILVQKNPELKPLFNQAVKDEWNSARFERELQNTSWYKRLSERQRAIQLQKATDPATWKATLDGKAQEISRLLTTMGVTTSSVSYWAEKALANDWDEADIRAAVSQNARTGSGETADVTSHLRETYAAYGIPVSDEQLKFWSGKVVGGLNTLGGVDAQIRNAALRQYPQFAEEINSGMTIKEIADPFVQTMANTLEISPADIGLNDKYIKQALQHKGADGKPATMNLYDFEKGLKQDARWDKTKQAKDETYAVLQQVGQDWGFL